MLFWGDVVRYDDGNWKLHSEKQKIADEIVTFVLSYFLSFPFALSHIVTVLPFVFVHTVDFPHDPPQSDHTAAHKQKEIFYLIAALSCVT